MLIVIYIFLLPIFLFFGDRGWWDGDAIAQLEGIVNFAYKGPLGVYRYYWQPLAYEVSMLAVKLTHYPRVLYYLPQMVGAADICLLLAALSVFSKRLNPILSFCILLLLPEIFFSGLYYNSTVFGMLPLSIALLFLFWKKPPGFLIHSWQKSNARWHDIRSIIIAATSVIAGFFRLDFLLCLPLLAYLLLVGETRRIRAISLFISTVLVMFGLFFMTGLFNPAMILAILQEHSHVIKEWEHSYLTPVWKAKVIFTAMNLMVWIVLLIYFAYWCGQKVVRKDWHSLLILLPALILLYPVPTCVSPKYLIPGLIFLPFVFAKMLLDLRDKLGHAIFKKVSYAVIAVSLLLQILSVQPAKGFPYIQITSSPYFQDTHDGSRVPGAYIQGYRMPRMLQEKQEAGENMDLLQKAAEKIVGSNKNSTFVMRKGTDIAVDRNWGWLSFYLQLEGYQVLEYSIDKIFLTKDHHLVFIERLEESRFLKYQERGANIVMQKPEFVLLQ